MRNTLNNKHKKIRLLRNCQSDPCVLCICKVRLQLGDISGKQYEWEAHITMNAL